MTKTFKKVTVEVEEILPDEPMQYAVVSPHTTTSTLSYIMGKFRTERDAEFYAQALFKSTGYQICEVRRIEEV